MGNCEKSKSRRTDLVDFTRRAGMMMGIREHGTGSESADGETRMCWKPSWLSGDDG
jgi:hypothetical protein